MKFRLFLASGSPRRVQMLKDLELNFKFLASEINEKPHKNESPKAYVKRLSFEKCMAIAKRIKKSCENWAVLGADTSVIYRNKILGKPVSKAHALEMLLELTGKTHEVITGYTWICNKNQKRLIYKGSVTTKVTFEKKSKKFLKWYVSTLEPMDKAGAYAAQGIGVSFISRVNGSYSNVVGLPLSEVLSKFEALYGDNLVDLCRKT